MTLLGIVLDAGDQHMVDLHISWHVTKQVIYIRITAAIVI